MSSSSLSSPSPLVNGESASASMDDDSYRTKTMLQQLAANVSSKGGNGELPSQKQQQQQQQLKLAETLLLDAPTESFAKHKNPFFAASSSSSPSSSSFLTTRTMMMSQAARDIIEKEMLEQIEDSASVVESIDSDAFEYKERPTTTTTTTNSSNLKNGHEQQQHHRNDTNNADESNKLRYQSPANLMSPAIFSGDDIDHSERSKVSAISVTPSCQAMLLQNEGNNNTSREEDDISVGRVFLGDFDVVAPPPITPSPPPPLPSQQQKQMMNTPEIGLEDALQPFGVGTGTTSTSSSSSPTPEEWIDEEDHDIDMGDMGNSSHSNSNNDNVLTRFRASIRSMGSSSRGNSTKKDGEEKDLVNVELMNNNMVDVDINDNNKNVDEKMEQGQQPPQQEAMPPIASATLVDFWKDRRSGDDDEEEAMSTGTLDKQDSNNTKEQQSWWWWCKRRRLCCCYFSPLHLSLAILGIGLLGIGAGIYFGKQQQQQQQSSPTSSSVSSLCGHDSISSNRATKQGRFDLIFTNLEVTDVMDEMDQLENLIYRSYNFAASGGGRTEGEDDGCEGLYERVLENVFLIAAVPLDNSLGATPLTRTSWTAYVWCNQCPDEEPVFADEATTSKGKTRSLQQQQQDDRTTAGDIHLHNDTSLGEGGGEEGNDMMVRFMDSVKVHLPALFEADDHGIVDLVAVVTFSTTGATPGEEGQQVHQVLNAIRQKPQPTTTTSPLVTDPPLQQPNRSASFDLLPTTTTALLSSSYPCFPNRASLTTAISNGWTDPSGSTYKTYGPISNWCFDPTLTDFTDLFRGKTLNDDISTWDVSNVERLQNAFRYSIFNGDISNWDVSKVTTLNSTFAASTFNQPLNGWDVSKVTTMNRVFAGSNFNQPLNDWDVSKVSDFVAAFAHCEFFNQDIGGWNVASATDMTAMLRETEFDKDISGWDVSRVRSFRNLFRRNGRFNQNISGWDVSSATSMSFMFYDTLFNQDVSMWDVSRNMNFGYMFAATPFNHDISGWNVASGTSFSKTFEYSRFFKQNLCPWGSRMSASATALDMFEHSACPSTFDPDLTSNHVAPLCYGCHEQMKWDTVAPSDALANQPICSVNELVLTDVGAASNIRELNDGDVIDWHDLHTNGIFHVGIIANVRNRDPSIQVKFYEDGIITTLEQRAPYCLGGGNAYPCDRYTRLEIPVERLKIRVECWTRVDNFGVWKEGASRELTISIDR